MSKQVTLVFTGTLTPYFEGDVATFSEGEAEQLLNPVLVDEKGKPHKLEAKCVVYDPKKHAHLLAKPSSAPTVSEVEEGEVVEAKDEKKKG